MKINASTQICMVIGDPIAHSLSPQMHNAGYKALNIEDKYVYVACRVAVENIPAFIAGVKAMGIRGVSCTLPHKIEVIPYLDKIDQVAQTIGAVNTIVNDAGTLSGYNTDWLGVVKPLTKVTSLQDKLIAVLGAGGAARAAVYGLSQQGAKLRIFNRTLVKAQMLANEFGGEAYGLDQHDRIREVDIIFNATSLGLHGEMALPPEVLQKHHIVFDAVYNYQETQLIKMAKNKGATIIHGIEMLLYQGLAQFSLYTRQEPPEKAMRDELLKIYSL